MESQTSHPKQRSRRGCVTCRRRKVKCDEYPGTCRNCRRLGLPCRWPGPDTQHSRVNRACVPCRQRKTRCHRQDDSTTCSPCRQAGLICSMLRLPTDTNASLGRTSNLRSLVEAFFSGPHEHFFFSFIHRPSFLQMLDNDLIQRHLVLIMCASVQRIRSSSLAEVHAAGDAWADESRELVMRQIFTKLSAASLQTLLLLQRYEESRGAHLQVWLLSGLAIRVAHALQLNREHENQPITVREVRRRIMWSCVSMDSIMEPGVRPVSGMRVDEVNIRLPCNQALFLRGDEGHGVEVVRGDPAVALAANRDCIDAQMISLALLRWRVVKYTFSYHRRNVENLPAERPWCEDSQFWTLRAELDNWARQLPSHFKAENSGPTKDRVKLLSLHCLFHGAFCDLLRIGALLASLHGAFPTAPAEFLSLCARDLLDHAHAICQGVADMSGNIEMQDPYAAVCGCLALRLLIIDRRPQEKEHFPLADPAIRCAIDASAKHLMNVARWSDPVRRYLNGVRSMALKRGYGLPVDDVANVADNEINPETSRAPSPSLRTYGTFGTVTRELGVGDDEITTASPAVEENATTDSFPEQTAVPLMASASTYNEYGDIFAGSYDPLSEEALQTFTEWTDGTYDLFTAGTSWTIDSFTFGSSSPGNHGNYGANP